MARIIDRTKVPQEMREAWDRLILSHERLDKYKEDRIGDRDEIVDENASAITAYRRICRAEGYIGTNGRTRPPHLTPERR
jgi:hypothetical protein